jgi:hypothetical protein
MAIPIDFAAIPIGITTIPIGYSDSVVDSHVLIIAIYAFLTRNGPFYGQGDEKLSAGRKSRLRDSMRKRF